MTSRVTSHGASGPVSSHVFERARLDRGASGLRHLRWAREVLASLEAHYEHDPLLAQEERELVLKEALELRASIATLSGAVKPYRDFLERRRTQLRGMLRVGAYLKAAATTDEHRGDAEAIAEGFDEAFAHMEARERAPLKAAVRAGVEELHRRLAAMDGRLVQRLPPAFVESLYPALTRGGTIVVDVGDGDDDAAAAASDG